MKIENMDTKAELDRVVLRLSRSEAAELRDSLEALLQAQPGSRHEHIPNADHSKEITVLISS